jgi:hypothetical protein
MSEYDNPLEPSQLDLSSEPVRQTRTGADRQTIRPQQQSSPQQPSRHQRQPRVRLYFSCCKVFAYLTPPQHVLQGEADLWRAHCPRCGGLIEILFE